jgi:hypothetical protein
MRNQIFDALFDLIATDEGGVSTTAWTGPSLLYTSRRIRMFNQLPAKPAMCQGEFTETYTQKVGLPYTRIFETEWWFFHEAGADSAAIPTKTNNDILDAVDAILAPPPYALDNKQTLGGLVFHCFVDGTIIKVAGDIEGQALIIVPIKILVP